MDDKKMAFIGEVENGWFVEIPKTAQKWVFVNVSDACEKMKEIVGCPEVVAE